MTTEITLYTHCEYGTLVFEGYFIYFIDRRININSIVCLHSQTIVCIFIASRYAAVVSFVFLTYVNIVFLF